MSPVRSALALPSPGTHSGATITSAPPNLTRSRSQQQLHPSAHILDPLLEHLAPPNDSTRADANALQRLSARLPAVSVAGFIQPLLLLVKVMTLQPDVTGRHVPVMAVLGLTVLAVWASQAGSRSRRAAVFAALVHVVVLWAVSVSSQRRSPADGSETKGISYAEPTQPGEGGDLQGDEAADRLWREL